MTIAGNLAGYATIIVFFMPMTDAFHGWKKGEEAHIS